jgi:hypothetical protein
MSMRNNDDPDILDKLDALAKQASKEKSHYYVATVVGEAHREIVRLRKKMSAWRRAFDEIGL